MAKFNEYLKTACCIIFILYFSPTILTHIKHSWIDNLEPSNKIGYLYIDDIIESSTSYSKCLHDFFQDSTIKAILLHIESSGGSAGSCQALAFDIENLKKEFPKPIICYTENMCTSGAYQIAASTDHIVATGCAIIGNIGARIHPIFNVQEFLKKYDISCQEISTGQFKNTFSPFNTLTDDQKNMLQSLTDNTYQQLTKEIAFKRHLQLHKIDQWGQGKIFTGQQAYDLKLIDAIGSKTTAIKLIKKHIIPSDRKIEWIKAPTKNSWNNFLSQDQDDQNLIQTSIYTKILGLLTKNLSL